MPFGHLDQALRRIPGSEFMLERRASAPEQGFGTCPPEVGSATSSEWVRNWPGLNGGNGRESSGCSWAAVIEGQEPEDDAAPTADTT